MKMYKARDRLEADADGERMGETKTEKKAWMSLKAGRVCKVLYMNRGEK